MKKILTLLVALCSFQMVNAQNPFEQFGHKGKVLTATNGRFNEFHDLDSIVQIGSVLLDVNKLIIVGDAPIDTVTYMPSPTVISRWLSPDPLADKYYTLSPYTFVANNPIKFIDPDGRKIVFANNVSKEFKQAFKEAVQYLKKHGVSGMLRSLQSSKETYTIAEGEGVGTYNPKTRTITWDSNMGVITTNAEIMSPAAVLNHEADHANQHDQNPDQYNKDRKTKDDQYGNKEEKRVIEGSEQETAQKTGETEPGRVTRKDHEGTPYETTGPTSTTGKNEVIITAPKEEKKKKN
jgi:hypothetical protein